MTRLQRIVIPAHYLADVKEFAMEAWFGTAKHCPKREELLKQVDNLYRSFTSVDDSDGEASDIRDSDSAVREMIAQSLGFIIRYENSLADYVAIDSTLPSDPNRWYAICCSAAWLVMQIFVRELVRVERGGR